MRFFDLEAQAWYAAELTRWQVKEEADSEVVQAVTYPTYAEQFPTRVRYTGLSLAFNGGTIIGGGLTPFLATWLTSVTGDPLAPGYLLMVATVVALLTLLTVRETARRELAR